MLNKGGERWLLDKLATWERSFPLYELLTKTTPLFDEDDMVVYLAGNAHVDVPKLMHFALGLFWRASVHSWKKDAREPRIQLGSYSEEIRKWLLGIGEFPQFLYLIVIVEKPERAQITMNDPYEGKREGWRTHFFHVPGVLFMMALGKTVDESLRALAINNTGNPINVSKALTDDFERLMVESLMKSRKTKAFLRAKAKHDADRNKATS